MSAQNDPAVRPGDILAAGGGTHGPVRVLVADADPALFGLLEEWLAACGCRVASSWSGARDGCDLILVDVPFPRHDGQTVKALAGAHPHTPIVVLSSSFFPGVEACGAVARSLGVAGVLPKPLNREALLAALAALCPVAR